MRRNLESVTELNNGVEMPLFGLGVYKAHPGDEVYRAVRMAVENGYRLIDTAARYENERGVGKAVRDCGLAREKLFVTTKLWPQDFDDPQAALDHSLRELNTDYIDLYLMHWPGIDEQARLRSWDVMLENREKGKIRACGVSNFYVHHLEHLIKHSGVTPADNQIEMHPWQQQREIRAYCQDKNIAVTAWGPLFHGHLQEEPLMAEIGEKYGKSAAQVTLRWHVQQNVIVIPKSVKEERIRENADVFDFSLSAEDMARIDALDGKGSFAFNADEFDGDADAYKKSRGIL